MLGPELKEGLDVEAEVGAGVGAAGVDEGVLGGRWMGGLLCLLRMPMREAFFWVCSACCCCCCWLSTCWFKIS